MTDHSKKKKKREKKKRKKNQNATAKKSSKSKRVNVIRSFGTLSRLCGMDEDLPESRHTRA